METTYREITHRGITFTRWERLVVDESGVMTSLSYKYGKSPEPGDTWLHSSGWHDNGPLECPCGGGSFPAVHPVTGEDYEARSHLRWTGQQCPPERIAELRELLVRIDQYCRERFEQGDLAPHLDNPPY